MSLQTILIKPAYPLQKIVDNLNAVWNDNMRCSTNPNERFPPLDVLQSVVQSDATDGKYFAVVCVDTDTNTVAGVLVAKRSGQVRWWTSRTSVSDADTLAIQEAMCSVAQQRMGVSPWGYVSNADMRAKSLLGKFILLDDLSAAVPADVPVSFAVAKNYPPGEIIVYDGP